MISRIQIATKNLVKPSIVGRNIRQVSTFNSQNLVKSNSLTLQTRFNFCADEVKKPVEMTAENAQQIIDTWVKKNQVLLFMKGTPANPQCGYSNFVV